MNKFNKSKVSIFVNLLFIVIFAVLSVFAGIYYFTSNENNVNIKNSPIGLIFIGLLLILAICVLLFSVTVSKEKTKKIKEDDFIQFDEDDFDTTKSNHIEEVDYKIIAGIESLE